MDDGNSERLPLLPEQEQNKLRQIQYMISQVDENTQDLLPRAGIAAFTLLLK